MLKSKTAIKWPNKTASAGLYKCVCLMFNIWLVSSRLYKLYLCILKIIGEVVVVLPRREYQWADRTGHVILSPSSHAKHFSHIHARSRFCCALTALDSQHSPAVPERTNSDASDVLLLVILTDLFS